MAQKRNISDDLDHKVAKESKITKQETAFWPIFKKTRTAHLHRAKKGQMENLILRFPQLFEEILGSLDYQTLVKCNVVDKSWYNAVTNQRIYWTQMIIKYTNSSKEYHKQWMKAIEKAPFEILKKLAELARDHCSALKDCQKK